MSPNRPRRPAPPGANPTRRRMQLVGRVAALATVAVLLDASAAAADPAGPSDFRSEVTGFEPAVEGLTAEIRGGDSFIEISVDPGHVVTVEGYSDELYLQVLEDGTVQRNRLSAATYLNEDRRGGVGIPAEVKAAMESGAEPEWETIADGGTYAWHDHRVHWMSDASPQVGRGERVSGRYDPWQIPITVDGESSEIRGFLVYERQTSPLPWVALALASGGLLGWFGRGRGLRTAAVALAVVAAVAVVVGRADWASTPDGGGNPLLWILPVVALVAAVAGTVLSSSSPGVIAALAAVASLSGWALFRVQVLLKPVLPTELPFALDRATVALALGASAAVAYLAVTSGALSLPELEDD